MQKHISIASFQFKINSFYSKEKRFSIRFQFPFHFQLNRSMQLIQENRLRSKFIKNSETTKTKKESK